MYKQNDYLIKENTALTDSVFKMTLEGDTSYITAPGQFINIALDGKFLRRPISVCDYDSENIVIVYKVVGGGTRQMSKMCSGETLNALTGLGNGFDITKSKKPLLIGGGVGVPPMYCLAKTFIKANITPSVVLGFNTENEIFFEKEFKNLGCRTVVTTADGSYGVKGFVTDALGSIDFDYFYTCGPMPMFRAINAAVKQDGQFSFEERMGCGFGACMGCSCKTKSGYKRICKDGPVLEKGEIIW